MAGNCCRCSIQEAACHPLHKVRIDSINHEDGFKLCCQCVADLADFLDCYQTANLDEENDNGPSNAS